MKIEFLILTSLLAFCSICYELLFANTLSLLSGGAIWWHSLTIGIYIAGLGIGTFKAGKSLFPARDLVKVELLLSLIGMSCAVIIYFLSGIYETADAIAAEGYLYDYSSYISLNTSLKSLFFIFTQSLVFIIGYLSGFEVPLLLRLTGQERHMNRLLAANYIGTLIGTLCFAYFLLPKLDVLYTAMSVGGLNLFASCWIIKRFVPIQTRQMKIGVTFAIIWLITLITAGRSFESYFLQVYYRASAAFRSGGQESMTKLWQNIIADGPITRSKSLYQYIDYFDVTLKGSKEFVMMLDTNFQFSSKTEKYYHESFAHIPMMIMNKIPQKVLILGAGDGLLAREILKYEEITLIKQVELDELVVEISKKHPLISKLNEGSLENDRLDLIIGDAFQYLRDTNERYDAIFIDFPYPKNYNISKLFSVEFYRFVKRALNDDGFMVIDVPLRHHSEENSFNIRRKVQVEMTFLPEDKKANSIVMSTVYAAGFKKLIPYKIENESFLFATSSNKEVRFDLSNEKSSHMSYVNKQMLSQVGQQHFPFDLKDRYINSVFHPLLIE